MSTVLQPRASRLRATRWARRSVVLTLLALAGLASYLAWDEGYFTPVAHYNFEARSSRSLSKGMPVHLSGFKIGQVSRVELQADRSVRVDLAIFRPYLGFICTDTEVRLESGMPIGDAALEIVGAPTRAPNAAPGAQLKYRGQPQLFEQIEGVVEQVSPMIENVNALLVQARQPDGELQTALRNLSRTTGEIQAWMPGFMQRTDDTLAVFNRTGGTANAVLAPLAQGDGDLQASIRDLRAGVADLRAALPPILADLKAVTASLRGSATALEPAVNQMAPKLPALVDETNRTAAGAGEVVDAVKDFSLIRSKINQPVEQPLLPTNPP